MLSISLTKNVYPTNDMYLRLMGEYATLVTHFTSIKYVYFYCYGRSLKLTYIDIGVFSRDTRAKEVLSKFPKKKKKEDEILGNFNNDFEIRSKKK